MICLVLYTAGVFVPEILHNLNVYTNLYVSLSTIQKTLVLNTNTLGLFTITNIYLHSLLHIWGS